MSRNSKNAKRIAAAKSHKRGTGPAQTQPKHGKKNAWWQKFPSYAAYLSGAKRAAKQDN